MTTTHPSPASPALRLARDRVLRLAILAGSLCMALHVGAADAPAVPVAPLVPIATLDLPRYMGTWYEVAKFPNRFQGQCTGPASAAFCRFRLPPACT